MVGMLKKFIMDLSNKDNIKAFDDVREIDEDDFYSKFKSKFSTGTTTAAIFNQIDKIKEININLFLNTFPVNNLSFVFKE